MLPCSRHGARTSPLCLRTHRLPALAIASAAARGIESELLLFPKYIGTIRSWALSSVATVEGPKTFTHVWEQEFASIDGFTGEYMQHPLHWGLVDSYFDSEFPHYVVDPFLIQMVGEIDGPVIRPG